ncbi:unnamed protein product, partial [Didymodactylos carnosus]
MAVARRVQSFNIKKILYCGNREKKFDKEKQIDQELFSFVPFEQLIKESDFVLITCSLNENTKNLFNENIFKQMKNDSILINTSRGGIIDQQSLYNALVNGEIRSAGLDVTVPEPLPLDHPLLTLKNCLILPHIGSAEIQTRNDMCQLGVQNLINFFDQKSMVHQINVN